MTGAVDRPNDGRSTDAALRAPMPAAAGAPAAVGGPEVVLVALVAANGVIGDGRDQPWHFREDFRRFKALTMGHPLVMGRRTFDAIGRALPGRETVVLTRDRTWCRDGVHVAHDLEDALRLAAGLAGGDQIMVLGGGQVYEAVWPWATRLELTEVDAPATGTTTFPRLDAERWRETRRDDRAAFAFVTYERTGPAGAGFPSLPAGPGRHLG